MQHIIPTTINKNKVLILHKSEIPPLKQIRGDKKISDKGIYKKTVNGEIHI